MLTKELRILLVDDDEDDYLITEELLYEACPKGVKVVWASSYKRAVSLIENEHFDLFLFDYRLGPDSGLELTKWTVSRNETAPIILLTGMDNHDVDMEAMHSGATDYLIKQDLNPALLERAIRYSIRQKTDEIKLLKLAHFDPLTGLANRNYFQQTLNQVILHAERQESSFAILTLDLDHFKNINDTLGHAAGDDLLVSVSNMLREHCRSTDTIARLGGDEFVIIATHLDDKNGVEVMAKKILEAFALPINIGTQAVSVGISMGISLWPHDTREVAELLKQSDQALYQAKASGRNTFCFYDEAKNRKAHEQAVLQNEISLGIKEHSFQLHYQPVVDMASAELQYVEALMRWKHPKKGMITPVEFIPLMELNSNIVIMGEWAIHEAARQHVRWREEGLPAITIAVNVSARQFASSSLLTTIQNVMADHQLSGSFLILELTESVLMPTQQVLKTLHELQTLGIKVSIDDFGTGYSSLAYLKRFHVDTLKIDREFIKNLPDNSEDHAITAAIIALGKALKLRLVAEGIETSAQQLHLQQLGCHLAQGYLFSRPLPHEEFVEWYLKHQLRVKTLS